MLGAGQPVKAAQAAQSLNHSAEQPNRKRPGSDSLDPTLRTAQLEFAENRVYEGSGRNIFQTLPADQPGPPQKTPPPAQKRKETQAAPALRLRFFGFCVERARSNNGVSLSG
jgi:hypothetical protein